MDDIAKTLFGAVLSNYGVVGALIMVLFCAIVYGSFILFKKLIESQNKMMENQNKMMENQNEAWNSGFKMIAEGNERQTSSIEKMVSSVEVMRETHSSILANLADQQNKSQSIELRLISIEGQLRIIDKTTQKICENTDCVATAEDIENINRQINDVINVINEGDSNVIRSVGRAVETGLRHVETMLSSGNVTIAEIRTQLAEIRATIAAYSRIPA